MNPLGIIHAMVTLFETLASAANPKERKQAAKEKRQFLFIYCIFMLLGTGVIAWAIYLYCFGK